LHLFKHLRQCQSGRAARYAVRVGRKKPREAEGKGVVYIGVKLAHQPGITSKSQCPAILCQKVCIRTTGFKWPGDGKDRQTEILLDLQAVRFEIVHRLACGKC